ncbi:protein HGH1 homolog [Lepeophtheirus salmonis]|uniref:Protein HGH1 homolog n=1 Tax=Lepeophtheirus salmonis TaxID=72036 RepID=D3PG39_LEPSM|nr:protein HGH1 homolog [Lepeophtheirus salmonis]ADD24235.1 Brain protein 16 [Lepeophtheirus salmonis]
MSEVLQFLDPSARLDVRVLAMNHILGMTGDVENRKMLLEMGSGLFEKLLILMTSKPKDNGSRVCCKDASLAIINLSCEAEFIPLLLEEELKVVRILWDCAQDRDCELADPAVMIASNLTIQPKNARSFFNQLESEGISLTQIIGLFTKENYNSKGAKLHYLASLISNLSQLPEMRSQLTSPSNELINSLLPYTEYKSSSVRRGGIIGTLRNITFDESSHNFLLKDIEILTRLLLPLAGPTPEHLESDQIESLPLDLQYLDHDKQIEEDPDVRKMILEALTQLCATKDGREFIRGQNAYIILREFHKVEKDKVVKLACENLVDILIKKEEEIKVDNYKDVKVPENIISDLKQMDKEYLEES